MADDLGRVLLVGGTGMLAGLAEWLAPRSTPLVLACRAPLELAAQTGADPWLLDWNDEASVEPLLVRKFDLVISRLHENGLWLTSLLEALLVPGGRSIRVHDSRSRDAGIRAALDPAPRADITRQVVVIGWDQHTGSRRWLSYKQICDGVIDVVNSPETALLIIGEHLYD